MELQKEWSRPLAGILYMLKGKITLSSGTEIQHMTAGKMYIVYLPWELASWYLSNGFCSWFTLFVKPFYLEGLFGHMEQAAGFFHHTRQYPQHFKVVIAGNITQWAKQQVKDICRLRAESQEWELTASAYGKNLLAAIANALRKPVEVNQAETDAETLRKFIDQNMDNSPASKILHMSIRYICITVLSSPLSPPAFRKS